MHHLPYLSVTKTLNEYAILVTIFVVYDDNDGVVQIPDVICDVKSGLFFSAK